MGCNLAKVLNVTKDAIIKYLNVQPKYALAKINLLFLDNINLKLLRCVFINETVDLHLLVMMTNKFPELNDYLEEYLKTCDDIDKLDCDEFTALHLACRVTRIYSTERTIELLINAGANVNTQSKNGYTPLHCAIRFLETSSTEKTIELLINAGTNVNLRDEYGLSPLHYMIRYFVISQSEINYMSLFDTNHINKLYTYYRNPSLRSKKKINKIIIKVIKLLIDAGADTNFQNNFGQTALHMACCKKTNAKIQVELLINAGANVNLRDNNGNTPLHIASTFSKSCSFEKIVELLINEAARLQSVGSYNLSAYLNLRNNQGDTALHLACKSSRFSGMKRIVELLINAGTNINLRNNDDDTPLHIACYFKKSTIGTVELLVNANATVEPTSPPIPTPSPPIKLDINSQNKFGETPLHCVYYLKRRRERETVKLLILADADVFNLKDDLDNAPCDYFSRELLDYCQIDKVEQTIGIRTGRFTKPCMRDKK